MPNSPKFKDLPPLKKFKGDNLRQNIPLIRYIYFSFLISTLNIVIVIASQNFLPPEVPLFFGLAKGEEQLTSKFGLILPGIISFSITLLNLILSYFLEKNFLQKILVFSSLTISFISLVAVIKIVSLVGSF